MLERIEQMEELQLIINQLEEKNTELEKEHRKDNHWFNGQMKEMGQDIKDLKDNNEKMLEYLHMKCETLERQNHRLLEFGERIKELTEDIPHYDDIYKTKTDCIDAMNELLTDYDFK